MHGPNIGTSGGEHAVSEGLFTSLSLLAADADLPGIWLVVSGWTEEPSLDAIGKPDSTPPQDFRSGPVCRAVAVALTADTCAALDTGPGCQLSLHMPATIRVARHATPHRGAAHEILDFARALDVGQGTSWSHTCPWGAEIRLTSRAAVASGVCTTQRGTPRREAA